MIKIEEVRQEVMTTFKSVHESAYPDTLVNYPNHVVVDLDKQKDPFVSLELDLTGITRAALGEKEILVPGILFVYFYFRIGTGTSHTSMYTDMLNEYLGGEQFGSLQYEIGKPMDIQSFPGWKGTLNAIQFNVVSPMDC